MKAVMFVAGNSTRTHPLTVNYPKPLLPVLNKTIITHNMDQLHGLIDELILVVGFKKELIQEHLKSSELKITYVEQNEQLGTGHALLQCKNILKDEERFVVMGGDDLFSKNDIKSSIDNGIGSSMMLISFASAYLGEQHKYLYRSPYRVHYSSRTHTETSYKTGHRYNA